MGKPVSGSVETSVAEYIGCRGERGELKHLSNLRKRKQIVISKVAASEMETAQTKYMLKPESVVYLVSWGSIGRSFGSVGKLQI